MRERRAGQVNEITRAKTNNELHNAEVGILNVYLRIYDSIVISDSFVHSTR